MIILADTAIPFASDAAKHIGEVRQFDSRDYAALKKEIQHADILLCRSTISVNRMLLNDSLIQFIATATSGTDHVDMNYLQERNIGFASAAGSNARSVAEYVFAGMIELLEEPEFILPRLSIGIIGVGWVGSIVVEMAQRLGMKTILCDPPRAERGDSGEFTSIDEALNADIVTVHVPLTTEGVHRTIGLIDSHAAKMMTNTKIFFNTARGGVVTMNALHQLKRNGTHVVLDVFEHEPNVSVEYAGLADVLTPHIAGHSFEGKVRGAKMVYDALVSFLGVIPEWTSEKWRECVGEHLQLKLASSFKETISQAYDIRRDDQVLRDILKNDIDSGKRFAAYRTQYPVRREFSSCVIPSTGKMWDGILSGLGFILE